jgi:hypothetical protein
VGRSDREALESLTFHRFERCTVGRERAHSTGLESTSQTGSAHRSVSAGGIRITRLSSGSAARSGLL